MVFIAFSSLLQSGSVVFLLVFLTGHVVSVWCFLFFLTTVVLVESLVEELEGVVITGESLVEGMVITGELLEGVVITGGYAIKAAKMGWTNILKDLLQLGAGSERVIHGKNSRQRKCSISWLVDPTIPTKFSLK